MEAGIVAEGLTEVVNDDSAPAEATFDIVEVIVFDDSVAGTEMIEGLPEEVALLGIDVKGVGDSEAEACVEGSLP